jgi:CheY-like chemotaxis protein
MTQGEPAKILIVDDEPDVRQLLVRFLAPDGYQCATADSGEAALKLLQSDTFDLVLTDIMMPAMSGMDLLNIVKTLFPDVAVLMVTAVDDRDTGVLAVELGAYGYIIKPFERNEILIDVAHALERRRVTLLNRDREQIPEQTTPNLSRVQGPKRISPAEAVKRIRSGMDDASLMKKFSLSAKALHSLFEQLVAADHLRKSEIELRSSLSPGTVILDLRRPRTPSRNKEKSTVSAADVVNCIRSGMDDPALMKRYRISARGLRSLYRKLLDAGFVSRSELDTRMLGTHDRAILDENTKEG